MQKYTMTTKRMVAELGESISLWRRINRVSVAELAERSRVSKDTISRLEHGDCGVSIGTLVSVCRVMGLDQTLLQALDPASNEFGRMQLRAGVPRRAPR